MSKSYKKIKNNFLIDVNFMVIYVQKTFLQADRHRDNPNLQFGTSQKENTKQKNINESTVNSD